MKLNERQLEFISLCLLVAEDTFREHAETADDGRIQAQFLIQAEEAKELRRQIDHDEESAAPRS